MPSKAFLKAVLRVLAPIAFFIVIYIKYVVISPSHPKYQGIMQTGRFAIGQGQGSDDRRLMQYRFEADGRRYTGNWTKDDNEWMTGRKSTGFLSEPGDLQDFLVIYDPDDPKRSLLRCDCPIGDSIDFRYYVQNFEKLRLQGHIELKKSMTEMMVK